MSCSPLIVLLFCVIFIALSSPVQVSSLECAVVISINKTVDSNAWEEVYNDYKNESNVNLTFISLETALQALENNISTYNSCIEVLIPSGSHTIENRVVLQHNIRLIAEQIGEVDVKFNVFAPEEEVSFYVLEFLHAELVEIHGINFYDGKGIIGIENITNIHVSYCKFR